MLDGEQWPFAGLRVVDLTTQIAGPYATKLLVDAGALVIKVESPQGDPMRRWSASGAELAAGEDGPLFDFLNASKLGVVLDLDTEEGRAALLDLVDQGGHGCACVVGIENNRIGLGCDMDCLGHLGRHHTVTLADVLIEHAHVALLKRNGAYATGNNSRRRELQRRLYLRHTQASTSSFASQPANACQGLTAHNN